MFNKKSTKIGLLASLIVTPLFFLPVYGNQSMVNPSVSNVLSTDNSTTHESNEILVTKAETSFPYISQLKNHISLKKVHIQAVKSTATLTETGGISIALEAKEHSAVHVRPENNKVWNLSAFHALYVTIENSSEAQVSPSITLTSQESDKWQYVNSELYIEPGETKSVLINFLITSEDFKNRYPQFTKMNAGPTTIMSSWKGIDLSTINNIRFEAFAPKGVVPDQAAYTIKHIAILGKESLFKVNNAPTFPFVDEFGQHLQSHYPGKLTSSDQWIKREQEEQAELKKYRGAQNRSKWGGWLAGPKQKATGYFYTKKISGKWWFVDPEGYLFWSHGVTGVGHKGANTLIKGREHYFKDIPSSWGAFSDFHEGGRFDFTMANLYRKYGKHWEEVSLERNHQRLKSWGMNTYGNWSQPENQGLHKTPFTVAVHYKSNMLDDKFPDPWDENFSKRIKQSLKQKKGAEQADSPWNIGFFVDNELHFYQDWSYAKIITSAKKSQPAKIYFVEKLKSKYVDIANLNKTWKTDFSSFKAILTSTKALTHLTIGEDSKWFYQDMVERYFRLCRESVKSVYPNHLYLGSRVHGDTNEVVLRAAEKYVDVISYNLYQRNLKGFTSRAKDLTKPLMATEFHFGALDRGVFHTGLQGSTNQKERAQHYAEYVKSALNNPLFVGTHWFQYRAQAITGRGDGENYQIGLVDITDTPYPETIKAVRKVGYQLYDERWKSVDEKVSVTNDYLTN